MLLAITYNGMNVCFKETDNENESDNSENEISLSKIHSKSRAKHSGKVEDKQNKKKVRVYNQ